MDFKKDYYSILGVSRNASKEELKAAYRKLAKANHPDLPGVTDKEKIKEINEAWEVLGNPAEKAVYDEFRDGLQTENSSHIRKYERTYTVTKIEKVYLRGQIKVKYWADALQPDNLQANMVDFLLNPVETIIEVEEENLDVRIPSALFNDLVKLSDLLRTPIQQPVLCEIKTKEGIAKYNLNLQDIRIQHPELKDINKYDGQSLGTLTADVFAEIVHPIHEEHTEQVTECFGPTGRKENKQEEGWNWERTEYYHADCTSYWSSWEKKSPIYQKEPYSDEPVAKNASSTRRTWRSRYTSFKSRNPVNQFKTNLADGCGLIAWIFIILLALFLIPQAVIPFLIVLLLSILGGRLLVWLRRAIPFLLTGLFGFVVLAAMFSNENKIKLNRPSDEGNGYDTTITGKTIVDNPSGRNPGVKDTLIEHRVRWMDYDSQRYEVKLAVRASAVNAAGRQHNNIAFSQPNTLTAVYRVMDFGDNPALDISHAEFDSLRRVGNLNAVQFANMLVSCVQSLPYFLVTDQDCNPRLYQDEFIRSYLRSCKGDCCLGNVLYGVRSPVEFLSDLKGDCDTRALFIYSMLSKFNYKVAIITSEYYRHAAIAVQLPEALQNGSDAFLIKGEKYYVWETTNRGFRAGVLPRQVGNLKYWEIALINR